MSFQIFQVPFSFEFQQTWKYQKLARMGHNVEKDALVSGFASSVSFLFQNVSFLRVSSILRVSIYYLYLQIAMPSELEVAWLEQARCGLWSLTPLHSALEREFYNQSFEMDLPTLYPYSLPRTLWVCVN